MGVQRVPNSTLRARRKQYRQGLQTEQSATPQPMGRNAVAVGDADRILLYTIFALAALGLVAVYSASAREAMDTTGNSLSIALRQLIYLALGFGLMYGVSRYAFFNWSRFAKWIAFGVIGLLAYTMTHGVVSYGAERWIHIFGVSIQPSELGKISVVLLLAQALGQKIENRFTMNFLVNLGIIGVTILLIIKQPSLSMTIILSTVSAALMFIAGIPLWILTIAGGGGGFYLVHKLMHTEYQMRRIRGWLNPWKDPQDTGYNLIQSLYAIGSGGFLGRGIGMSHQKLYYLPFQYTDFIFAVWAEEWGWLGCIVLIGLFVTLLYRGFVIARTCRSSFGQLLAMGITLIFAAQIIINMSVATGLFPVTGVTLPLVSAGGTSVIVTMFMLGILLNISRYRVTVSRIAA